MPKQITTEAYEFDELDDAAKNKAREWYREGLNSGWDEWWDSCYYDFQEVAERIGISFDTETENVKGKIVDRGPKIYFSGFCSQGDGACFVGGYACKPDALAEIRDYAPQDTTLHCIAERLMAVQQANLFGIGARVTKGSGMYSHEYTVDIEVFDARDDDAEIDETIVTEVKDILRDFMRWMYRSLEATNDDRYSDECVDDYITGNEYLFTKEGERHEYA